MSDNIKNDNNKDENLDKHISNEDANNIEEKPSDVTVDEEREQWDSYIIESKENLGSKEKKASFNKDKLSSNEDNLGFNKDKLSSNEDNLGFNEDNLGFNEEDLGFNEDKLDFNEDNLNSNKNDLDLNENELDQEEVEFLETTNNRRALDVQDDIEQNTRDLRKGHLTYNQMKNKKKKSYLIIVAIVIALVAAYFVYNSRMNTKYDNLLNTDTFYEGVYVDGIALGGLTKEEAFEKVTQIQKEKESEVKVIVKWDDEEIPFINEDVNILYDTQEILDKAFNIGREGSKRSRYKYVLSLIDSNQSYETTRAVDPSAIESRVRNIAIFRAQSVGEPAVAFNPDPSVPKEEWFDYSDPIIGIETDDQALWESVKREFEQQTFGEVPVPKWEINPSENIDLRSITKEIVSFKSRQSRNTNREHNIALGCSLINGTILMPGEEFSMNNTTGERTETAGFKEANTIVGGNELVPGIAGGVCQISGTLFNAAFRADLEITERHHHSFELGYLPRGRDATVNWGTADLRFVNNKEYPIYISMYTIGRDVYADIFGAPLEDEVYIDMWVKTIEEIPIGEPVYVKDTTVPKGEAPKLLDGHTGIKCDIYKIFRDTDGKQTASEKMYTDIYKYYAPELHVNPEDYEGYINPTPVPTSIPNPNVTPAPTSTPAPTEESVG